MRILHAIAEVIDAYWFGVRHYANRGTAISCGVVVAVIVSILLVAAIANRISRSSESRARHTE